MKKAFVIIRVSAEDQLKGYGPDVQWLDDVIPNAPLLGLEVDENHRRVIQESATGWERIKFEATVREAMALHKTGEIDALLFPRVDRETRFLFGSMPLLVEVVQSGLEVYFAREKLRLDPNDSESVERYLNKATQAQAYVETMRINTTRGRRRRAEKHGKMPGGRPWLYGYAYDKSTGTHRANERLDIVRMQGMWVLEEQVSTREVCRRLMDIGIPAPKGGPTWYPSVVQGILTNPTYAGKTYAYRWAVVNGKLKMQPRDKWLEVPNATEGTAFTWEEFEGIQRQLRRNFETSSRNTRFQYDLRGRIRCKSCGRRYGSLPSHGKPYYRCRGRSEVQGRCRARDLKGDWIHQVVWSEVERVLKDPEILVAELQRQRQSGENTTHLEERISLLDRQLAEYEESLDRYLRMYGAGLYSYEKLEREVNRVKGEQEKVHSERADFQTRLADIRKQDLDLARVEATLTSMATRIEAATHEDRALAYEAPHITPWVDTETGTIEGRLSIPEAELVSESPRR